MRGFVLGEPGAVGAGDRHRLGEDRQAQRAHVVAPQYLLPPHRQRGDRVGDGVEQQLLPLERREVGTEHDAQRHAVEQRRKGASRSLVGHDQIVPAGVAQPDVIGGKPLAVVIHQDRNDRRIADERLDALDVVDAVLQDRDPSRAGAQPR